MAVTKVPSSERHSDDWQATVGALEGVEKEAAALHSNYVGEEGMSE